MSALQRTEPVSLARRARHRRPLICTCCRRHVVIQLARHTVRGLVLAAAIGVDVFILMHLGA